MDKNSRPEKKPWQKPELIVLVRSKPEEAVLVICKAPNSQFQGPNANKCKLRGVSCFLINST